MCWCLIIIDILKHTHNTVIHIVLRGVGSYQSQSTINLIYYNGFRLAQYSLVASHSARISLTTAVGM